MSLAAVFKGWAQLRERCSAAVVLLVGLVLIVQGLRMPLGTLASFGPGLFPTLIGGAIVLTAVALIAFPPKEHSESGGDDPPPLRAMVCIGLGMVAFALLVRSSGIVPAALAVGVFSSLGDRDFDLVTAALVSAALAVLGVAIFIWGLSMPLQIFRW